MKTSVTTNLLIFLLFLFLWGFMMPLSAQLAATQPAISLETCTSCHEEIGKAFQNSHHGILDSKGLAAKAGMDFSCISCHREPGKHVDEGGGIGTIMNLGSDMPSMQKSDICLSCHKDNHGAYFNSPHAKVALDCTSCHSIHQNRQTAKLAAELCTTCHSDVSAQFRQSEHHRLQEGVMSCTSCHNPHEASSRGQLGGFKQELCLSCHTDKQGPFLHEHGAGTFEGCNACHTPHGSSNRHLLKFQNTSDLCFSCHAMQPNFHSRFTKDSRCTNCHYTIHGSNLSKVFLK